MSRFDELTAFEVAQAERQVGMTVEVTRDPTAPKVEMYGALAWVHVKRSEPTLTFDEYMKRSKPREPLAYLFGSDEDEPEPEAGDEDLGEEAGFPEDTGAAGESSSEGEGGVLPASGDRPE